MLQVEKLRKSYRVGTTQYEVCKGISLGVAKGEFGSISFRISARMDVLPIPSHYVKEGYTLELCSVFYAICLCGDSSLGGCVVDCLYQRNHHWAAQSVFVRKSAKVRGIKSLSSSRTAKTDWSHIQNAYLDRNGGGISFLCPDFIWKRRWQVYPIRAHGSCNLSGG